MARRIRAHIPNRPCGYFTEVYGSGTVDDFLSVFNPFTHGPDGNVVVETGRVLAAYRQTRARFPGR
jgi:hypothetical protein